MSTNTTPQALLGMKPEEISAVFTELGQPAFRAKQLVEWVFAKRVASFDEMTNLPKATREALATRLVTRSMSIAKVTGSADTTRKFLLKLQDGRFVVTEIIQDKRTLPV